MLKKKALRKLTIEEKEARGTRQKVYDPKPRGLTEIQADIDQANEMLESLQFAVRDAAKFIRELGVVIPTGRGAVATVKPNPCLRIQAWAMGAMRGVRRELTFLREELTLAAQAEKPVDDDFAGLD
jgi:hypothetical protein